MIWWQPVSGILLLESEMRHCWAAWSVCGASQRWGSTWGGTAVPWRVQFCASWHRCRLQSAQALCTEAEVRCRTGGALCAVLVCSSWRQVPHDPCLPGLQRWLWWRSVGRALHCSPHTSTRRTSALSSRTRFPAKQPDDERFCEAAVETCVCSGNVEAACVI